MIQPEVANDGLNRSKPPQIGRSQRPNCLKDKEQSSRLPCKAFFSPPIGSSLSCDQTQRLLLSMEVYEDAS